MKVKIYYELTESKLQNIDGAEISAAEHLIQQSQTNMLKYIAKCRLSLFF